MSDGMTIDMGSGPYYSTWEGIDAWSEAIEYMTNLEALPALEMNQQLWEAALYHNEDTGPLGLYGHDSSDGTDFATRVKSFFTENAALGENIAYGSQQWGENAEAVIAGLLVDDGVPSRGHRTNLFSPDWTRVGISVGYHSELQSMTTMDFAS